jgi:hypothetical protein
MGYDWQRRAMRDNTMETLLRNQGLQRTDKGYSERATEQQDRMRTASEIGLNRRTGVGILMSGAKNQQGIRPSFGSSGPVSLTSWST